MLVIPQRFGGLVIPRSRGAAPPASIVFRDSDDTSSNSTSYTFSGLSLGTADPARYIVAAFTIEAGSQRSVAGVTIAGVTATHVDSIWQSGADERFAAIYIAAVPTGTSGSVVISFDGTVTAGGVSVYDCRMASTTPVATSKNVHASGGTITLNLNTQADGIIVAAGCGGGTGSSSTYSGITEDVDISSGEHRHTSASATTATTQTPRSVSVNGVHAAVCASFR